MHLHPQIQIPSASSGVFSTGATGAIAPVILRKRIIAPVILHLPCSVIILTLKIAIHQCRIWIREVLMYLITYKNKIVILLDTIVYESFFDF